MYSLLLQLKRQIKRLFKVRSESRQPDESTRRHRIIRTLMLVIFSLAVGIIYPGDTLYDPLDMPRKGAIAPNDIIAPFSITVLKTEHELRDEVDETRIIVPFVLDDDTVITQSVYTSLKTYFTLVDSLRVVRSKAKSDRMDDYPALVSARYPYLSQAAISRSLNYPGDIREVHDRLAELYRTEIYNLGVIKAVADIPESRNKMVVIRRGERETLHQRSKLQDIPLANARLLTVLNRMAAVNPLDVEYYYLLGRSFIQPNLWLNMPEYNRRIATETSDISNVQEVVNKGDLIVSARQRVDEREDRVLQELSRILRSDAAERGWLVASLPAVARVFLVLALFITLYLFLFYFRREIFLSNPKLFAILLVFGVQLVLVWLVDHFDLGSVYLYPIAVLPIMITILFDAQIGILATFILAILLGVLSRFSFTVVLVTLVVGIIACFSSRVVRRRSHFYRILLLVAVSSVGLAMIVENLKLTPGEDIVGEMLAAVISSGVSIVLVMAFLPVFESLFGITTDTTLLELSDLNQPLLKRLAIEAPGTYHHSIIVGNLCESAAKAISANALLARVGAYYHDIGKIEIPEYFIENQLGVKSRHEALSPSMSALILSSHVKKGRLLGEEANIPDDVLNFIEEHHGTMVMTYFYNKAVEQGHDNVPIDKFRYPGPRPQTRETGIAMLADAVEAASRTLDDPKPARIDSLIQRIIDDRFKSGELDECPLTLRDLAKIKEAFAQVLIAAFHQRVAYPRREKADER